MTKGSGSSRKKSCLQVQAPNGADLAFAFPAASLRAGLLAWYRGQRRDLPWRRLDEHGRADPYRVWVSEIMLQQTLIKVVIPVYERFLSKFPTVHALAAADDEAVREAVRGLGYYRRFRMMHAAAGVLSAAATWPTTFLEWKALPGVGDYTAAAVSSIAFGAAAAVVDGNVDRVFCRLLDLREAPNQAWLKPVMRRLAAEFLDPAAPGDFNQALMELGQTVCTLSAPRCGVCPLNSGCLAAQRNSQSEAPATKLRSAEPLAVNLLLLILHRSDGRIALLPRPARARFLGGIAGFLTGRREELGPWQLEGWTADAAAQLAPLLPEAEPFALGERGGAKGAARWQPVDLGSVRHGITHHRITALVLSRLVDPAKLSGLPGLQWVDVTAVEAKLTANLDRKAWSLYLKRLPRQVPLGRSPPALAAKSHKRLNGQLLLS